MNRTFLPKNESCKKITALIETITAALKHLGAVNANLQGEDFHDNL